MTMTTNADYLEMIVMDKLIVYYYGEKMKEHRIDNGLSVSSFIKNNWVNKGDMKDGDSMCYETYKAEYNEFHDLYHWISLRISCSSPDVNADKELEELHRFMTQCLYDYDIRECEFYYMGDSFRVRDQLSGILLNYHKLVSLVDELKQELEDVEQK